MPFPCRSCVGLIGRHGDTQKARQEHNPRRKGRERRVHSARAQGYDWDDILTKLEEPLAALRCSRWATRPGGRRRMNPRHTAVSESMREKASFKQARLYWLMLRHWAGLIGQRGYWHAPQGLGTQFVPGRLAGYFNDLTNKVNWSGATDGNGLPLNQLPSGESVYFPTAVFQKALGHWDLWLSNGSKNDEHQRAFLTTAQWAADHQDDNGGWTAWSQLGLHYESPYSALTQGEGVSLLVRATEMTGDRTFADRACEAGKLMLAPVEQDGLTRAVAEGLVFEEISNQQATTILNGWIFALFGLYDLCLACPDRDLQDKMEQSLKALCAWLPRFDAGFWSLYETGGSLASPFYHQLHIAQLQALEKAFPSRSEVFSEMRQRFEWQASSRVRRMRAIACKAIQKFKNPPDTVLR